MLELTNLYLIDNFNYNVNLLDVVASLEPFLNTIFMIYVVAF